MSAPRRIAPVLALALFGACAPDAAPDAVAADAADAADAAPAGPAAERSRLPSVAGTPDGALLAWIEEPADGAAELRVAHLGPTGWESARTVARGSGWFLNWADFPAVATGGAGGVAAHWLVDHPDAHAYGAHFAVSSDGGATWSAPRPLREGGSSSEYGFVSWAPLAGGGWRVVWLDGRERDAPDARGDEMALFTRAVADDGELGPEEQLDERVCSCCPTALVRTADGAHVVAYRDRTQDEVRDVAVLRSRGAGWEPVALEPDGWTIAGCPVNGPALAATDDGVALARYTEGSGGEPRVLVAFARGGDARFGPSVRVDGGRAAGRVDAAPLGEGEALVSWLERADGGRAQWLVAVVGADGSVGEPTAVAEVADARSAGVLQMARAGASVLLAWADPDAKRVRTAVIDPSTLR